MINPHAFGVVPLEAMVSDDVTDTYSLPQLATEARAYLEGKPGCPQILAQYFGVGVPGVLGVFLFQLAASENVDSILWVVVGDLPSAHLVVDEAPDAVGALECYCSIMESWARSVLKGESLREEFPVAVEPTPKHAEMLLSRVVSIREDIIPAFR